MRTCCYIRSRTGAIGPRLHSLDLISRLHSLIFRKGSECNGPVTTVIIRKNTNGSRSIKRARMTKRTLATAVGALAILGGVYASLLALKASEDFQNPAAGFWPTILGETIVCSAAFVGFGIGIRFLYFGWTGHEEQTPSWVRTALISIGVFFPGFIISLPVAFLCAARVWGNLDIALPISISVGLISSLVCVGLHVKWRRAFLRRK